MIVSLFFAFLPSNRRIGIDSLNALLRQEVLQLVLYALGIIERGVHIAVTMRVWNALNGAGCRFPERDRCADGADRVEFVFFAGFFALGFAFFAACCFCSRLRVALFDLAL